MTKNQLLRTFLKCRKFTNLIAPTIYKIIAALGVFIILFYLIYINFYPRELSIGDTFVFIFTTFSFGTLVLLGLISCAIATHWIVSLAYWIGSKISSYLGTIKRSTDYGNTENFTNNKSRNYSFIYFFNIVMSILYFLISILLFFVLFMAALSVFYSTLPGKNSVIIFFSGFTVGGLILSIGFKKFSIEKNNKNIQKNIDHKNISSNFFDKIEEKPIINSDFSLLPLAIIAVISSILIGGPETIIKYTMKMTGIRIEGAALLLNEENFKKISAIAHSSKIELDSCKYYEGQYHILYGVDLLWHGIGKTTLVRLNPEIPDLHVDTQLDSSHIEIVSKSKSSERICKN